MRFWQCPGRWWCGWRTWCGGRVLSWPVGAAARSQHPAGPTASTDLCRAVTITAAVQPTRAASCSKTEPRVRNARAESAAAPQSIRATMRNYIFMSYNNLLLSFNIQDPVQLKSRLFQRYKQFSNVFPIKFLPYLPHFFCFSFRRPDRGSGHQSAELPTILPLSLPAETYPR